MHLDTLHAILPLARNQPQRLEAAAGLRLRAVEGRLWITIEGDARDFLLDEGEAWTLPAARRAPGRRMVWVSALADDAQVELCAAGNHH